METKDIKTIYIEKMNNLSLNNYYQQLKQAISTENTQSIIRLSKIITRYNLR